MLLYLDHDPNPLLTLNKRKRRFTDDLSCERKASDAAASSSKNIKKPKKQSQTKEAQATSSPETKNQNGITNPDILDAKKLEEESEDTAKDFEKEADLSPKQSTPAKQHKKHRHKHKHKHKHKHNSPNSLNGGPLLHVEQGDGELRMRIKSPPPNDGDNGSDLPSTTAGSSSRSPGSDVSSESTPSIKEEQDTVVQKKSENVSV